MNSSCGLLSLTLTCEIMLGLMTLSLLVPFSRAMYCKNTVILDGTEEVTNQVCSRLYLTNECNAFSQTFDKSLLPKELQGTSVQRRPQDFLVTEKSIMYKMQGDAVYYPGLVFSWKSPSSDAANNSIKGFYLWIQSVDGKQEECRILTIDHSDYENVTLSYSYTISKMSVVYGRNYTVKIYSLPPPATPEMMQNSENFRLMIVSTTDPFNEVHKFPADWTHGISVYPNVEDRSIDVYFNLPPSELAYGFTNYTVKLDILNRDLSSGIIEKHVYISQEDFVHDSGYTKYNDLPTDGVYQVSVDVVDSFPMEDGKCQCRRRGLNSLYCHKCSGSKSVIFDLNGNVNPEFTPRTLPPPSPNEEERASSSKGTVKPVRVRGGGKSDDLVPVVSAVACVSVLGIVFVSFCFWRRRKKKRGLNQQRNDEGHRDGNDAFELMEFPGPLAPLTKKTVYLLASSDHKYHQNLIKAFVDFLRIHCFCKVITSFDFDATRHQCGSAPWLAKTLNSCQRIIILDSVGAHRRFEEFNKQNHYRHKEMGPEGDLFNLGLLHINTVSIAKGMASRLIMVTFGQKLSERLLDNGLVEYILPKDLSGFLVALHHDLEPKSASSYKKHLLPKLPSPTSALLQDIQTFEHQNPDWFSTHFDLVAQRKQTRRVELMDSSSFNPDWDISFCSSIHYKPGDSVSVIMDNYSAPSTPCSDRRELKYAELNSCVTMKTTPYTEDVQSDLVLEGECDKCGIECYCGESVSVMPNPSSLPGPRPDEQSCGTLESHPHLLSKHHGEECVTAKTISNNPRVPKENETINGHLSISPREEIGMCGGFGNLIIKQGIYFDGDGVTDDYIAPIVRPSIVPPRTGIVGPSIVSPRTGIVGPSIIPPRTGIVRPAIVPPRMGTALSDGDDVTLALRKSNQEFELSDQDSYSTVYYC